MRDDLPNLVLRPLAKSDEPELIRIHTTPGVRRWWDLPAAGFPWDEPESTRWTIEVDGVVAGLIQFSEESEPRYRHAGVDLFIDPALHGRGLGTEAVRRVVRHLIEDRGHHRITIDPAVANAAAIRAYEKVGFRPVGVMRGYERDAGGEAWHDGLLMELLACPARMALRAFPVVYAKEVELVAAFYVALGFQERFRMPGEDGRPGFIGLRRGDSELAVTTEQSPRVLAGIEPGVGPRHELFVYVEDVDAALAALREAGGEVLRDAADMPWGERIAYVDDPEGNVVVLAMPAAAGQP